MTFVKQFAEKIVIDASNLKIPTTQANNTTFENIIGGVYMAIGAVALFFIIRGALLYVTNGSDPSVNKQARETVIYAVVALVGSTLVFALIHFVIGVIS